MLNLNRMNDEKNNTANKQNCSFTRDSAIVLYVLFDSMKNKKQIFATDYVNDCNTVLYKIFTCF